MTPCIFFPLIALDNGSSQRNHLKEERGARPKGAHDMAKQFGNYPRSSRRPTDSSLSKTGLEHGS